MNRLPVKSSNIKSVGHDPVTSKLHVEFHNGRVFEYDGVDTDTHSKLMSSDSVGSFFSRNIRPSFKAVEVKQD